MISKENPPTHLKQLDTGRIYVYTATLAKRADMEPYAVPKPEVKAAELTAPVVIEDLAADVLGDVLPGEDSSPVVDMSLDERKLLIKGASELIGREHWIKGTTAWQTSPAPLDIEAIVGFKVSRREIIDAIKE